MEEQRPDPSVECSVVCLPSECLHHPPSFGLSKINNEWLVCDFGSNTVALSESNCNKLHLKYSPTSGSWVDATVKITYESKQEREHFLVKRPLFVVMTPNVDDNMIITSEELFYNLQLHSGFKKPGCIPFLNHSFLTITNSHRNSLVSVRATKVVIAMFQSQLLPDNSYVDELLRKYFLFPRYLCKDEIFSITIDDNNLLDLMSTEKGNMIYFKVCDMIGPPSGQVKLPKTVEGYFVDSTVEMYRISNIQDFLPVKRFSVNYKLNIYASVSENSSPYYHLKCSQNLVPQYFHDVFSILSQWMEPFFCFQNKVQDVELRPLFLLTGPNGSGKALLLQALSQYFGVQYWRVDCISIGGHLPGHAETKLNNLFSQLKTATPCVLHLANIETLCHDEDSKENIRIENCFEKQVKDLKLPAIIVATTSSKRSVSSRLNQLFLDSVTLSVPDCGQREDTIRWLVECNRICIDDQIVKQVAAQTSGFRFRDLEVLITLALKENYKRSYHEKEFCTKTEFTMSDFSKIIGKMNKAYSNSIGAPKVPSVSWQDIGAVESLKNEILRSLKSRIFHTGLKRSGLLLHGPPGTGKTLLAKAVATECSWNFLSVKGPELLNMYVGQSEQNVRDLFELAKAASPCIVFFDELDSLAPNRGHSGDSGGVMDRVVSQLLAELDDLGDSNEVFILGATNRPDLIDPALLRPGRLDKLLFVGPCEDRSSQLSVMIALTRRLQLEPDVDLEEIVSLLPPSVTGAQLSAFCSAAWMESAKTAINNGEPKTSISIRRNDFISVLNGVFN